MIFRGFNLKCYYINKFDEIWFGFNFVCGLNCFYVYISLLHLDDYDIHD